MRAGLVAGLSAAAVALAAAQSPRTITVRIDNDAFNFWKAPADRPDEEYTSGVRLIIDGGDMPRWARALGATLPACVLGGGDCRTQQWEFGQDIYSPRRTVDAPVPPAGSRVNAGWLFAKQTARALRDDRSDEVAIALGVTGPPSLAEYTQRLAHAVAPAFNRPTDWNHQIGFEPGVVGQYVQTRRIAARTFDALGLKWGADVLPMFEVELGNVRTNAGVGAVARVGIGLRHPWLPAATAAPAQLAFAVGIAGRGVARDITLDGNTLTAAGRVGHEPFVSTATWAIDYRWHWLRLAYGAATDSRAYAKGPASHTWASFIAAVNLQR